MSTAGRRGFIGALAGLSVAGTGPAKAASAPAGAAAVFASIDALEREVAQRLGAVAGGRAAARAFLKSVTADRERHRRERLELRKRFGLAWVPVPAATLADPDDLALLRERQQALVHAHAEGLPALHDPEAVDTLGKHMVDLARQLAVIDLWLEPEREEG